MKAAWNDRYGPAEGIEIRDIPRPEIGPDEVLVRVEAAGVNTADWRIRAAAFPGVTWLPGRLMFGLRRPRTKVMGGDFSGRIVAKGESVACFRIGDAIFGAARPGAHAEYLKVTRETALARKPAGISHVEAAAVPFGALAALVFLRDHLCVRPGQRVLIFGASGGVGIFAVQLARHFGAEVTAVCSAANHALVTDLGASDAIDYRTQDVTKTGQRWDLILDCVGATTFRRCRRVLAPGGTFVPIEFGLREIGLALATKLIGGKRVKIGISTERRADMETIADLLERGVLRPVVDGTFPLDRIAAAHARVESRHKTGSVVLTMPQTHQAAA